MTEDRFPYEHGDIRVRLMLSGEPQKLLTYWRGSLGDAVPTTARVAVIRPRVRLRKRWFDSYDPSFHFEEFNRTEKKRAELSISERSLKMQPEEIEIAQQLTDQLFKWLRHGADVPRVSQPITNARVALSVESGPELVDVVEKFGDPEVLARATVGVVYTQGEPRRPGVRWLPELKGIDKTVALGELHYFEKSLAEGQSTRTRDIVNRLVAVFKRRVRVRRAALNKPSSPSAHGRAPHAPQVKST